MSASVIFLKSISLLSTLPSLSLIYHFLSFSVLSLSAPLWWRQGLWGLRCHGVLESAEAETS